MSKNGEKPKTPVVPDIQKQFPAMQVPPNGTQAFAIARDGGGNLWSVYVFRKTLDGVLTEKVMEREPYEYARAKVLSETINYQMSLLK